MDEFMPDSSQEMRFATSRVAKGKHILTPIHKAALKQYTELLIDLEGQSFAIKTLDGLLAREPRLP